MYNGHTMTKEEFIILNRKYGMKEEYAARIWDARPAWFPLEDVSEEMIADINPKYLAQFPERRA